MQNSKVRCESQPTVASGAPPKELTLFEREVRKRLTAGHVFGDLQRARVVGGQLFARCPLHGGHDFQVDLSTNEWSCRATNERGGALEFVRRLVDASGIPVRDSRRHGVAELARRCNVELPSRQPPQPLARSEADTVWRTCGVSVLTDDTVTRWLVHHGLNPVVVESYDVLRVVSAAATLPSWGGFVLAEQWCSWPQAGRRVVVPLVNAVGAVCSLMFCSPLARTSAVSVSRPTTRCVMADAITCTVLASQAVPRFLRANNLALVVVDGLIAFLRQLTGHGGVAYRPVLGLVGGSLDPEIASRLPSGTHLISAMDRSDYGNRAHESLERLVATARPDLILSRCDQP